MNDNLLERFVRVMESKHHEALTGANLPSNKSRHNAVFFTTMNEFAGALLMEFDKIHKRIDEMENHE